MAYYTPFQCSPVCFRNKEYSLTYIRWMKKLLACELSRSYTSVIDQRAYQWTKKVTRAFDNLADIERRSVYYHLQSQQLMLLRSLTEPKQVFSLVCAREAGGKTYQVIQSKCSHSPKRSIRSIQLATHIRQVCRRSIALCDLLNNTFDAALPNLSAPDQDDLDKNDW